MGAKITFDNKEVTLNSEVIILAVKPHIVPVALNDIKPVFNESNLLISVAGGVPIKNMEQALPKNSRIIRAMPNTPALVRQGASVFVRGSSASDQDAQTVINLFKSVGTCEEVPEYLLDGITGLSGSGPAYIIRLKYLQNPHGMWMYLETEGIMYTSIGNGTGALLLITTSRRGKEEIIINGLQTNWYLHTMVLEHMKRIARSRTIGSRCINRPSMSRDIDSR
ncbi:pyrroline-5-carboxylate reductase 1, mitochondrial-like isoform X2 [Diaphorina citri]|nr:pyrroline-5-carboxylate reductase 1, mitochondrial-like isoform X2 [Diaphorina citri]XP_026686726.1 pyrroline-5-carboxylate reductase 1, mitochondrial-like isoform X2 [Diaphorina citri]XP_026686727.1 pyrroline-5-carboxylate reductase 1, mitochondrial-like isoform X2 [Diaphorina citri]